METTIIRKSADPFSAAVLRGERSGFEGAIVTKFYDADNYCPRCHYTLDLHSGYSPCPTDYAALLFRRAFVESQLPLPDCRHGVNRALGYVCRTCDMEAVDGTYSLPPMREI